MAKRPVRFKNTLAVFNDASQTRFCDSSGREHYSPDNSADLSELVNSFIERDCRIQVDNANNHDPEYDSKLEPLESYCSDSENYKNMLESLLNDNEDDDAKRKIRAQTQFACGILGEKFSHRFKRRLMSHLRDQGFDAGLCKSRWEKFGRHPPGEYEYVDVNVGGNRFIVEVFLAGEFEIARPTPATLQCLMFFHKYSLASLRSSSRL
ncbi:hypothetical protein GH714_000172 [Hevea brasiliensis]|uniref:DUF506 family protein n=1 Tax=Hevea brasiliensis TaxID=3981 RepID=A0A6A6M9W9_HEVBR|nr:hypothetical protein GH714_000172 [Hevea brasiliensis]